MIRSRIPKCNLQANTHIDSRLKWLKQKYFAIAQMLKESGCKWEDTRNMIQCVKDWYERWCTEHKDASGLYGVEFKWFWELGEIYGKGQLTNQLKHLKKLCIIWK